MSEALIGIEDVRSTRAALSSLMERLLLRASEDADIKALSVATASIERLDDVIRKHELEADKKKRATDWWKEWEDKNIGLDSGYSVPQMYYFAIEPDGDYLGYKLYLCFKGDYIQNGNKFPWTDFMYMGRCQGFPEEKLGELDDSDSGCFWYSGDWEAARTALNDAGFTELPEMLETLFTHSADRDDDDESWA